MGIELRDYQIEAVRRAMEVKPGQPTLFVAPTAAGKGVIAAEVARLYFEQGAHVLFVAARGTIVRQTCDQFIKAGIPRESVGEFMAMNANVEGGRHRIRPNALVQVAGVMTLRTRGIPTVKLIIIDEAHHASAAVYRAILKANPDAVVIGFTATPYRMNGAGLDTCFDHLYVVAHVSALISSRYIVRPEIWGAVKDVDEIRRAKLKGIAISKGDYEPVALGKAMNDPVLMGHIVDEWHRLNPNRLPTVVFAASVAHSKAIALRFQAAGVNAAHIDAKTSPPVRNALLTQLDNRGLEVVCNYDVLGEGWDQPSVKCLVLARPTKSETVYIQRAGRVLRPYKQQPAIIIDHAGCWLRFKLPDEDREYSLTKASKGKGNVASPNKQCPSCQRVMGAGSMKCPGCGHVFMAKNDLPEIAAVLQLIVLETIAKWWADRLGTVSDSELAEEAGCAQSTVCLRRQSAVPPIESFQSTGGRMRKKANR